MTPGTPACGFVTLAPQPTRLWTPAPRVYLNPIRLLFVANDFVQKGVDFLMQLYERHLRDVCTLTIVSNDPLHARRQFPSGITRISGKQKSELLDVYRQSDLFLLPTQQGFVPQVVAEALTSGLPCLVNDVGGLRDLVKDGETGFVFPRDASTELWSRKIRLLVTNTAELTRMSARARQFAEGMLNEDRFDSLLSHVVRQLRSMPAKRVFPYRESRAKSKEG